MMIAMTNDHFSHWDWAILGGYLILVMAVGLWARKRAASSEEFFLAGRSMPWWAVAVSVLATSLSAATFIGGPEMAYRGDLTYFSANLGGLLAVIIVAWLFIPAFYRHQVTSVYQLLGDRFGQPACQAASAMFMLGRLLASGARLFIMAIPFSMIVFGEANSTQLVGAILLLSLAATLYTMLGGIRAVIWTDVLQAAVVVGSVIVALVLLYTRIPLSLTEIIDTLNDETAGNKLQCLDFSISPEKNYTLWTALLGIMLINLAAFGTDQDLTQRLLTCRSARSGSWSVIASNLIAWPVVFLFLCLGLLLYIYYQRPDIMGASAPAYEIPAGREVFMQYMLIELPIGLRGLMMAGLFAAAMSSTDSALNAMASTTVTDFLTPPHSGDSDRSRSQINGNAPRWAVLGWSVALTGFAILCVFWQQASGEELINFALRVMVFAYSGLLAVFLAALLTKRGNCTTVIAALITGVLVTLILQPMIWDKWAPLIGLPEKLAFPWQMVIATGVCFVVSISGKRNATTPVSSAAPPVQ